MRRHERDLGLAEPGHPGEPRDLEARGNVEHGLEQRHVVRDGLRAEVVFVGDVVVAVLDADVRHPHLPEEGAEVRADDARVVLLAALLAGALLEPVVEELVAGHVRVDLGEAAAADVGGLGLVLGELGLSRAELVEDRALPLAAGVGPADAPLVTMSNGLGHGVAVSFPRPSPPRPCNPERRCCSDYGRSALGGPRLAQETKKRSRPWG